MAIKFILCLSTLLVMSCGTSKNPITDNSVDGKPELKVASSKVYDWKNHKDFKIFYKKVPGKSATSYTIDHTAGSYVFDTKGTLRLFLKHQQGPQPIAEDLAKLLK
jgi:hypothetical protein